MIATTVLVLAALASAGALGGFLVGAAVLRREARDRRVAERRALVRYRSARRRQAWAEAYAATVLRVESQRVE